MKSGPELLAVINIAYGPYGRYSGVAVKRGSTVYPYIIVMVSYSWSVFMQFEQFPKHLILPSDRFLLKILLPINLDIMYYSNIPPPFPGGIYNACDPLEKGGVIIH